ISHLEHIIGDLHQKYQQGSISKSYMEKFIQEAQEGSKACSLNVTRAAGLVKSFKNISVDQSDESIREIRLLAYLEEIVLSLQPRLKNLSHKVYIACPDDLVVTCNPGAIAQIITNLIMNALTHAFDD